MAGHANQTVIMAALRDVHAGETVTITIKDQDGNNNITTSAIVQPDGTYTVPVKTSAAWWMVL